MMKHRAKRMIGAGLGLSALLVVGTPAVASAASAASGTAKGESGKVSVQRECGFQDLRKYINCNDHNYRIRVTYYNNSAPGNPGGEKLLCVKPGETDLYAALPMVGVFTSAEKLNDDTCST
ncbi:hypothetical protein [Streptomyces sp. NPDC048636]|uniref:hypothetical protein n=1 Tax=Streptomyces sp. NPDC048636 TaxID=3155762 RepID=UPI0034344F96